MDGWLAVYMNRSVDGWLDGLRIYGAIYKWVNRWLAERMDG